MWTFLLSNQSALPLVALPFSLSYPRKVIIPSAGVTVGTQAVPHDAGGSVDDWRLLGKIVWQCL